MSAPTCLFCKIVAEPVSYTHLDVYKRQVLHEEADRPLASVELPPAGEIVRVVGPEGGIAQTEVDAFAAVGVVAVRLGPEVLRTSTAGPAALAVLNGMSRWR